MGDSHLHPADVNRQHGGEEKHLKEEIRDQTDHSEQTELLHTNTQGNRENGKVFKFDKKWEYFFCFSEELHLNCWY